MSESKPTHILVFLKSQKYAELYRAENGMRVGQWKDVTVLYGEEPNKRSARVFMDPDHAFAYLRDVVADLDLKTQKRDRKALVEERDGEPLVKLAPNSIELPQGMSSLQN